MGRPFTRSVVHSRNRTQTLTPNVQYNGSVCTRKTTVNEVVYYYVLLAANNCEFGHIVDEWKEKVISTVTAYDCNTPSANTTANTTTRQSEPVIDISGPPTYGPETDPSDVGDNTSPIPSPGNSGLPPVRENVDPADRSRLWGLNDSDMARQAGGYYSGDTYWGDDQYKSETNVPVPREVYKAIKSAHPEYFAPEVSTETTRYEYTYIKPGYEQSVRDAIVEGAEQNSKNKKGKTNKPSKAPN